MILDYKFHQMDLVGVMVMEEVEAMVEEMVGEVAMEAVMDLVMVVDVEEKGQLEELEV